MELSSLYKITSGKLNAKSAEAYFNREFQSAETLLKTNKITKEEYELKVESISNARDANFKIPKEFKGKDRQ